MNKRHTRRQILEAIKHWQCVLESWDVDPTPPAVKRFLEEHMQTIKQGFDFIRTHFMKLGFEGALHKVGYSLEVVPDNEWSKWKTDPTETSSGEDGNRVVRIRQSYLDENPGFTQFKDECGWSFHEMVHAIVFSGNLPQKFMSIDSPFSYPFNTDEVYAFGFQIQQTIGTSMYDGLVNYYQHKNYDDFVEMFEIFKDVIEQK